MTLGQAEKVNGLPHEGLAVSGRVKHIPGGFAKIDLLLVAGQDGEQR